MRVKGNIMQRATKGSAGYDLRCVSAFDIPPRGSAVVSTNAYVELEEGYCALVMGRSGLAFKKNVIAFTGLIDSDYRGEIKVKLFNLGNTLEHFEEGDRIAQLVILPYKAFELEFVDELAATERGENGFGSTGAK